MRSHIKSKSACLFVQWARPTYRYLLVKRSDRKPQLVLAGSFEHEDDASVVEKLCQEVAARGEKFQQAVVLLSRGDLDVATLRLPPCTNEEAPELIDNLVAQTADDAAHPPVTDFVLVRHDGEATREAMAFTCSNSTLEELQERFKEQKARLIGVTFSSFGAVQLLRQVSKRPAHTSVVVTTTDQDTDLSVMENGRAILFRTTPRASDDETVLVQQLSGDIRRTLTLVGDSEDDSTRVYLIGTVGEQEATAKTLSDQLSLPVSVVNPFDQLAGISDDPIDQPSRFANLIGIACAWNRGVLELDLLHPRRPPSKPSPWRRVAFWGAIAAGVIGLCGYLAWEEHQDRLDTIGAQKKKLTQLAKRATKSLELQDIVTAVDRWRDDDIAWLDELQELSQRLPPVEDALIRRMTMNTNPQGNGVIDLSVQVSAPQVVARLEDAVRDQRHSVSSQRVTDTSDQANLPWQFETRIVFTPAARPALPIPQESDQDLATSNAEDEQSVVATSQPAH